MLPPHGCCWLPHVPRSHPDRALLLQPGGLSRYHPRGFSLQHRANGDVEPRIGSAWGQHLNPHLVANKLMNTPLKVIQRCLKIEEECSTRYTAPPEIFIPQHQCFINFLLDITLDTSFNHFGVDGEKQICLQNNSPPPAPHLWFPFFCVIQHQWAWLGPVLPFALGYPHGADCALLGWGCPGQEEPYRRCRSMIPFGISCPHDELPAPSSILHSPVVEHPKGPHSLRTPLDSRVSAISRANEVKADLSSCWL